MDAAGEMDSRDDDESAPDRYLLQLWPAPAEPDSVIRQTSARAGYWHREARGESHPRSPAEQDLETLTAAFREASPGAQQQALIFILERVVAVTELSTEPAAARIGERIWRGTLINQFPDELQDLAVRLREEAPPVPRRGEMDMHALGWRRLQAGLALTGALYHPVAQVIPDRDGPLFHARWALDEHWPRTRARAIQLLTAN